MPYTPNPYDTTQPADSVDRSTAAAEFRALKTALAAISITAGTRLVPPSRQCVLKSSVDSNGRPNYITVGTGLSVNIAATSVPVVLTAAAGFDANGQSDRVGLISSDTSISSLTASSTCYLYADIAVDGTVTFGHTTVLPLYQMAGTHATGTGAWTYNILESVGKDNAGAQVYRVFIGEAVTSGSAVTSVINYALQGFFKTPEVAMVDGPSLGSAIDHNLGVQPFVLRWAARCVSAVAGYSVGDLVEQNIFLYNVSPFVPTVGTWANTKQCGMNITNPSLFRNKTTIGLTTMSSGYFNYFFYLHRGW